MMATARQAYARDDYDEVLAVLGPALRDPGVVEPVLAMAANAALLSERHEQAIPLLLRLRERHPDKPVYARILAQACNRMGTEARDAQRMDEAEKAFQMALVHWPQQTDAMFNLASLRSERSQHGKALPLWRQLRQLLPDDHDVACELAICLVQNDLGAEAAAVFIGVSSPASNDVDACLLHAQALACLQQPTPVIGMLEGMALEPRHGTQLEYLAAYLTQTGAIDAAIAVYDRLFVLLDEGRRSPGLLALAQRYLLLAPVCANHAEMERQRRRYADGVRALVERLDGLDTSAGLERTLAQLAFNTFYLAYQGWDGAEVRVLQEQLGRLLVRLAPQFAPSGYAPAMATRHSGPARIGLLSAHWRLCTVGSYFGSWIGMLADAGHEVHVFQLGPNFDEFTESLGCAAHRLHKLEGAVDEVAAVVAQAHCDLLIYPEWGMDWRLIPLAALRLAPRQAVAWGHPMTTGLPTIDGYFTCAEMEPEDAPRHYSEPLLPLPGLGTDYHRPAVPAITTREALGLPDDAHLYLLPHAPYKMHLDSDAVWARIAATDPKSVLVLFRGGSPAQMAPLRRRLTAALLAAGADPERQLLILPMVPRERFLQINQVCDVMVDTLHWSGGNTSIDALLCGLPVVTCPGRTMRARQSSAMLRRIGLDELIVFEPAQLADLAVAIASDRERRQVLSRHIKAHLDTLFDAGGVAEALNGYVEYLLGTETVPGS